MSLDVAFVDTTTGRPAGQIPLRASGEFLLLPLIRITAEHPDALLEDWSIEKVTGLDAARANELSTVWERSLGSGGRLPLGSVHAELPLARFRDRLDVQVTWAFTYLPEGLGRELYSGPGPRTHGATVRLTHDPSDDQKGPYVTPSTYDSTGSHSGYAAIDFGTSNSTVTLHAAQRLPTQVLSGGQAAAIRNGLAELLCHPETLGKESATELSALLDRVAIVLDQPSNRQAPKPPREQLATRLRVVDLQSPDLVYATIVALEARLTECSPKIRRALSAYLAKVYDNAWCEPPLERLRLFHVPLGDDGGPTTESTLSVTVTGTEPDARVSSAALGRRVSVEPTEEEESSTTSKVFVYTGLKQQLGKSQDLVELPQVDGAAMSTDMLIGRAFDWLVGQTNRYIADGPSELGRGRVDEVVVTYPTMASPGTRKKLCNMLRAQGAQLVDSNYDEAVAAAMYFLMRDFGGDHDIGLEVMRSRSRPLPDQPGAWVQNMLVIDIGGGTADMALLTLTLRDKTPELPEEGSDHGRYYHLVPEVRGSTGKLQRGGELTTLRVLLWLKAALADVLIKATPEVFPNVLEGLRKHFQPKAPEGGQKREIPESPFREATWKKDPKVWEPSYGLEYVFHLMDQVVPTRSERENNRPGRLFWALWDIAEAIKFALFAGESEYVLKPQQLGMLGKTVVAAAGRRPLDWARNETNRSLVEKAFAGAGLTFSLKEFEELVSPDIDEVIKEAFDLAARVLSTESKSQPLDRVILTGQVSKAPLVRRRVLERISKDPTVECRPSAIVVEGDEHAKSAVSAGAAYARSIKNLSLTPEGARERLLEGRNELYLDTARLFRYLPCQFAVSHLPGSGGRDTETVLEAGLQLRMLNPGSTDEAVRSQWKELPGALRVYRPNGSNEEVLWGNFEWERHAEAKGLDPTFWRKIRFMVEARSSLELYVYLCQGDPHYLVANKSVEPVYVARKPPANAKGLEPQEDLPLAQPGVGTDPAAIVVNAYSTDGGHDGVAVFPAPGDGRAFPDTFVDEDGEAVGGVIGKPLPLPRQDGIWEFHYRSPSGELHGLGQFKTRPSELPPGVEWTDLQWIPTLDSKGRLHVHAGSVPFLPAKTLRQVQEEPGRVFNMEMDNRETRLDLARDPFNGRH
jgi:hypothetical protein